MTASVSYDSSRSTDPTPAEALRTLRGYGWCLASQLLERGAEALQRGAQHATARAAALLVGPEEAQRIRDEGPVEEPDAGADGQREEIDDIDALALAVAEGHMRRLQLAQNPTITPALSVTRVRHPRYPSCPRCLGPLDKAALRAGRAHCRRPGCGWYGSLSVTVGRRS